MKCQNLLLLCLLFNLSACQPPGSTQNPTPNTSATPNSTASTAPSAKPETAPSNAPLTLPTPQASQNPSQPVAVATGKPAQDLSLLKSLEIAASKRFLDSKGETLNLLPLLKDANGQALNATDFPLEWLSSRPADFAVDASGKVTALVEYGYSEITLRVPGTALEVKQLISVTELIGTSSGSGGTNSPTQENVNGTIEFQF